MIHRVAKPAEAGAREGLSGNGAPPESGSPGGMNEPAGNELPAALSELQTIYQQTPVGLAFLDHDLHYIKINEYLARINGLPVADHIGKTLHEVIPSVADAIESLMKRVLQTGKPVENVELHDAILRSGSPAFSLRVSYHPVKDAQGNIIGVNAAVVDITDSERVNRELRESQQQLAARLKQQSTVVELGHRALVGGDEQPLMDETAIVVANTLGVEFSAILEYVPEKEESFMRAGFGWEPAVIGRVHVDAHGGSLSGFTLMSENPVVCDDLTEEKRFIVLPLLTDHGIHSTLTAVIKGQVGNPPYGVLGVGSVSPRKFNQDDVSFIQAVANILTAALERKRFEQALSRSEQHFRELAESMPQIVWTVRADGRPEYYNRRWFDYTGQSMAEALNPKGWQSVLHPLDLVTCSAAWSRSLQTGELYEVEVRYRNREGSYRWFLVRAVPIEDEQGRITRWFGSSTDIDDQKRSTEALKRARERLRHYASDLERRVAERTATLQESVRSLEGVLYHVAHDLRAPLRAMQGMTTLLLEGYSSQFDEEGRDYALRIVTAAARMDTLIRDLLAYGRLGHVNLPVQCVDLEKLTKFVVDSMREEISERGADVQIQLPLPAVCANEIVLQQILYNLISNALKFVAPNVVPRVRIWGAADGGKACVSIEDNGIGIKPEHQERIFRVFERLHRADDYAGTGIGLAIVAKGIERMGGRVGVESQWGVGSRFWIELPEKPPPKVLETSETPGNLRSESNGPAL